MKKRTLTTVGLWSFILLSLYFLGPTAGVLILATLSTLALNELFKALRHIGYEPLEKTGLVLGLFLIMAPYYWPCSAESSMGLGGLFLALSFVALSCILLYRPTQINWFKNAILPTFWALVAVPFCLHFYIAIFRHWKDLDSPTTGLALALWVIAVAKFTDVGGFLGGYFLGKRKLAPNVSPKKTWEGAICGVALSVFVGAFIFLGIQSTMPEGFGLARAVWMSALISIISIPSDLFESVIKRLAGIKDSGQTLPGIGGAFDLADSLLFVGPVAYALISWTCF